MVIMFIITIKSTFKDKLEKLYTYNNIILIIPSILFFSNIKWDSKEVAIFLFIGGLFVFLNYKKIHIYEARMRSF